MRSAAAPLPGSARASDKAGGRGSAPAKDAWLNAIMSKRDAAAGDAASPWSSAGAGAARAPPAGDTAEKSQWRAARPSGEYPIQPPSRGMEPPYEDPEEDSYDPSASHHVQDQWLVDACALQAELDDSVLRKAFSVAVQEMVDEQDCCFIAKGLCHLCGVSENHFVPVVNFCPDANAGHSLCREHLRSIYRVRTEDLFAGRNRPMASRRALKCMVCSRTCPCSMCVLEKNHEINRYRRWLREEQQLSRRGHGFEGTSAQPSASSSRNDAPSLEDEHLRRVDASRHGGDHESNQSRQYYNSSSDLPMQAESKVATQMSTHGPKRSAKEALPPLRPPSLEAERQQTPPNLSNRFSYESGHSHSARDTSSPATVPSPSASQVINCVESEKSLVQLLTTLNQSSAGDHSTPEAKTRRPYEVNARDSPPPEPKQKVLVVDTRLANDDTQSARSSDRAAKRKRVTEERGNNDDEDDEDDDDDDDEYEVVESPGGTLVSSRSGRTSRKPREDYSSDDDAPLWPPRASKDAARGAKSSSGKKPGRPKTTDSADDRSASVKSSPASSSSSVSRKRKARNTELEMTAAGDRKNPRNVKASPPKSSAKDSQASAAAAGTTGKEATKTGTKAQQHRHHQDADEEESDLDTNLDYCEVCLAMGDLVCCDKCPRSFHLACLSMKESDLPEGDWQCDECKKPSHFDAFSRKVDIQPSIFTKCAQIIKCLKEHPFSKPFLTPVGDVPNYRDIVQQPMDLSTVASKLKRNAYAVGSATKGLNLDAFASDVRLIWYNCKLFNDDGSGITRAADELAAGFDRLLNLVKKKLPPATASAPRASISTKAEEHDSSGDPQMEPSPESLSETATSPTAEEEKAATDKDKTASKVDDQEGSSANPVADDESAATPTTGAATESGPSDDNKD